MEACLQGTIPPAALRENTFVIENGSELDAEELSRKLLAAGYTRTDQVEGAAQFSVRGSIIDIFPKVIVSKTAMGSEKISNMKCGEGKLPDGLSKRLIAYLSKMSTVHCICGRDLGDEERKHINSYIYDEHHTAH